jgi:hypothetical protein
MSRCGSRWKGAVASLVGWFMWMGEIRLENGTAVHAYKHKTTRCYVHLDGERRAHVYDWRRERDMYCKIRFAQALIGVFSGWSRLGDSPSKEELALVEALIDVALMLE